MILFASRTGTKRNLDAMRAHGWGLLISRAGAWRTEGFSLYMLDPGTWSDFQAGNEFDEAAADSFEQLLERFGPGAHLTILPDIVAGGMRSLELSLRWSNRCLSVCNHVLIAVQNGMETKDLEPYVGKSVGIFLGGDTAWKIERMQEWGEFCHDKKCWYHIGRCNTLGRFRLAIASDADSSDGTSGTKYAVNIPKITKWASQSDLLTPERFAA